MIDVDYLGSVHNFLDRWPWYMPGLIRIRKKCRVDVAQPQAAMDCNALACDESGFRYRGSGLDSARA